MSGTKRYAELYNALNTWAPSDDFYLDLVMSARSVLDVGCGTGTILHRARERGHTGRLCGIDPDPLMLDQARVRTDIDWTLGFLPDAGWEAEFDLVIMSAHVFQVFVEDDDLRANLAAVRRALKGRFVFETRNPLVKPWEQWNPEHPAQVGDVTVTHEVRRVEGDVVTFTETFSGPAEEVTQSSLRFLSREDLAVFLAEAGLQVEEQYGDWDRTPLTDTSREIITIAGRRPG